jgi:hypothetical protein
MTHAPAMKTQTTPVSASVGAIIGAIATYQLVLPALGAPPDLRAPITAVGAGLGAVLSILAHWLVTRRRGASTADSKTSEDSPLTVQGFAVHTAVLMLFVILGLYALSQIPMLFRQ